MGMALLVKCLLFKLEDPSSIPNTYSKDKQTKHNKTGSPGTVHTFNRSIWKVEADKSL